VGLLHEALPASTLLIAIDPGKVSNRVWMSSSAAGMAVEPLSLPVLRSGLEALQRLVVDHVGNTDPVFAIEATGGLHQVWVRELNQRFPGSVGLFAPSETTAARAQLGSRRFKTDDRDCADLTYLARKARGGLSPTASTTPWPPPCGTAGAWSLSARSPSSGCTTSSRHSARVCPRRSATAGH
jgi:hypothetical protein